MTNLPPLPKDRNWSPETWRAGLDEAVRLCEWPAMPQWWDFCRNYTSGDSVWHSTIAHATTLLDAGIVKPVVSEAEVLFRLVVNTSGHGTLFEDSPLDKDDEAAIAVIQSALDKARAGQ